MELFKYVTITNRDTQPILSIGLIEDLEDMSSEDNFYGFTYGHLDVRHMLENPDQYQQPIDELITGGSEDQNWEDANSMEDYIKVLEGDKSIIPFENEDNSIMSLLQRCLDADPSIVRNLYPLHIKSECF